jgi:hypothetical protein
MRNGIAFRLVRRSTMVATLAVAIFAAASLSAITTPTASAASSCYLNTYSLPSPLTGGDPSGSVWICPHSAGWLPSNSANAFFVTQTLYDTRNNAYAGYQTWTWAWMSSGGLGVSGCMWTTAWNTIRKCVI